MIIEGQTLETQRLKIETEQLNPSEAAPFVHIYHRAGDDSVREILLTPDEARFLRAALLKIFPPR